MFVYFRLITYWVQSVKTLLSQFLKKEIIYEGQPYIIGSLSTSVDPKEFNTGNIIYEGQPLTVIVKE